MTQELRIQLFGRVFPDGQSEPLAIRTPRVTIGRNEACDVVVPSPLVSGEHLEIAQVDGGWTAKDLGSSNGTSLNGQPLVPRAKTSLTHGDSLRLGSDPEQSIEVLIDIRDARASEETPSSAPASSVPARNDLQSRGVTVLADVREELTIGRDPSSDIHLDAPNVSWLHARIEISPDGYQLIDEGSTNGTFVRGRRVRGRHALEVGDSVKIGRFILDFDGERLVAREAANGMRVDVIQLRKDVGPAAARKTILHDVSLTVQPTEFVAFLGPSGAGKSTLLKAICGASPSTAGWVLVNGDSLKDNFELYRSQIGYVPQDDIIHTDLPVRSALQHAARLRLPSDTRAEEIDARIERILDTVELRGKEDVPIKALSGGQRKRVSIAVELLAEPLMLFLDEPTSGLDPGLDRKMMETLRRLARQGRTVFLVTHATANLSQCDHICLMAQGRLVYFGPPGDAFEFFDVAPGDFAEIYAKVDSGDPQLAVQNAIQWEQRYRESEHYARYVLSRNRELHSQELPRPDAASGDSHHRKGRWRQLRILIARYLELVTRDRILLTILLAVMPLIGLLVGGISDSYWLTGIDECLERCVESPPESVTSPPRQAAATGAMTEATALAVDGAIDDAPAIDVHAADPAIRVDPAMPADAGADAHAATEKANESDPTRAPRKHGSPPNPAGVDETKFADLGSFEKASLCLDRSEMTRRASLLAWSSDEVRAFTEERLDDGLGCPYGGDLEAAGKPRLAEPRASTKYAVLVDAQRVLFILALAAVLLGLFASAYEVVRERSIYERERMVNLSIASYLGSKFLVLGAFALLQGALLLGALRLAGLSIPSLEPLLLPTAVELYVTIVLATLASLATGLFISTVAPTRNAVIYIVLLVLFFQMLLSGGVFELSAITEPISRLNATRWTMEGLGASINADALGALGRLVLETPHGSMMVPLEATSELDYTRTRAHLATVWAVLVGFTVLFGILTAMALRRRDVV